MSTPFKMKSSPAKLFAAITGRKKVYDPETNTTTTYNRFGEKIKTKHHKRRGKRRGDL